MPAASISEASFVPSQIRVRIAPSPTGHLHVGTARTALYNYLYAHRHNGKFVLRLEDTDELRSQDEYTEDITSGLRWLDITWDEGPDIGGPFGPYRQTKKVDHYEHIAQKLITSGHAYHCYCTAEELAGLKDQQQRSSSGTRYDNRCRHITQADIDRFESQGRVPAMRFKIEEPRVVAWHDSVKGNISIDTADLGGDMVIVKSSGVAVYNFAVVVDDIDMHITHVIRGEDHIHNTAKQILLYEALGVTPPQFAHVALMFDAERRKLSKRHHGEAVHVNHYRRDGYMPEAMINYLAQMSWTHPEGKEIFSLEEACRVFDLSRVSASPAILDVQRLNWFNGHYLRHLDLSIVVKRAMPYLTAFDMEHYTPDEISQIIAAVRDGLTTLSEITEATRFFFEKTVAVPQELQETVLAGEEAARVLETLLSRLSQFPWSDHAGCKAKLDEIGKEIGLKGKSLYWPVRAAVCGRTSGPDLGTILSILGPVMVKERLESAISLQHKA
jgi:nondiscriminating glutamyl-tRNA synthetase